LYALGVSAAETRLAFYDREPSALGGLLWAGTVTHGSASRNRNFPHYALVYLTGGAGSYEDALGCRVDVTPGDVIFVFPGVRHSYGPAKAGDWDELYLVFDGPVFELWRTAGLLDERRPVRRLEPVVRWFGEFRSFLERPRPLSRRARDLELCRFLGLLTSVLEPEEAPASWLEQATTSLATGLSEPLQLRSIAADVGMSYESFRKRFRAATGMSPRSYREARRIEVACELLATTSMTHRQIAESLGYLDVFHFSKRFKAVVGIPPRQYRAVSP
jgi:AraC-like DNA-binding protein